MAKHKTNQDPPRNGNVLQEGIMKPWCKCKTLKTQLRSGRYKTNILGFPMENYSFAVFKM